MKKKTIVISLGTLALMGIMAMKLFANKAEVDANKTVKTGQENIAVSVATAEMRTTSGVYCAVRTGSLNKAVCASYLQG